MFNDSLPHQPVGRRQDRIHSSNRGNARGLYESDDGDGQLGIAVFWWIFLTCQVLDGFGQLSHGIDSCLLLGAAYFSITIPIIGCRQAVQAFSIQIT